MAGIAADQVDKYSKLQRYFAFHQDGPLDEMSEIVYYKITFYIKR